MRLEIDSQWLILTILGLLGASLLALVPLLILMMRTETAVEEGETNMLLRTLQAWLAEALGTFALVFTGILAISGGMIGGPEKAGTLLTVALAHGLVLAAMVAALGGISGGHFNPAVTLGFVLTRRTAPLQGLAYGVAQLVGAASAAFVLAGLFGRAPVLAGTPALAPQVTVVSAMVLEGIATFFLVLVVLVTAVDEQASKYGASLAIGCMLAVTILAIGSITGGAVNPARFFGPALAANCWRHALVYVVGPLVGGGVAALVHQVILLRKPKENPTLSAESVSRLGRRVA